MSKIIKPGGSVLAAQNTLAASLLSSELVILKNIPNKPQIHEFVEILRFLGVGISQEQDELTIDASNLNTSVIPAKMAAQNPHVLILIGPLLARLQKAAWPNLPATLKKTLPALGVTISQEGQYHVLHGPVIGGNAALEEKDSPTTLALVFASINAQTSVTLQNTAQTPEVEESLKLLTKMGASVKRRNGSEIVINPTALDSLEFAEHTIINDRHTAVRQICEALVDGQEVKVEGINAKHLTAFLSKLDAANINYKVTDKALSVWIEDIHQITPVEIDPKPYPGFEPAWLDGFVRMIRTYRRRTP